MKKYIARTVVYVCLSLFISSVCLVSMPDPGPWWKALAAGFGTVSVLWAFIWAITWGSNNWNA